MYGSIEWACALGFLSYFYILDNASVVLVVRKGYNNTFKANSVTGSVFSLLHLIFVKNKHVQTLVLKSMYDISIP